MLKPKINRLPDFLCLGPPKTATTWLYHSLSRHSDVQMPEIKECRYFRWKSLSLEEYQNLFQNIPRNKKTGDFTPEYILAEPEEIINTIPNIKVFCILRNPVDRMISHYKMFVEEKIFSCDLKISNILMENKYHMKDFGLYFKHISRYLQHFKLEDNFKIFYYDDLIQSPKSFMYSIQDYLGLKRNYTKFENKEKRAYSHLDIPISKDEIESIREFYLGPNKELYRFTGRFMNW